MRILAPFQSVFSHRRLGKRNSRKTKFTETQIHRSNYRRSTVDFVFPVQSIHHNQNLSPAFIVQLFPKTRFIYFHCATFKNKKKSFPQKRRTEVSACALSDSE